MIADSLHDNHDFSSGLDENEDDIIIKKMIENYER